MDALFDEFDVGDFPAFNPQFSVTSKPSDFSCVGASASAVEVIGVGPQDLQVYVLAPNCAPAHSTLRVDCKTTVGDVRAFIQDSFGVPLACQRWLSLLRQPAPGSSGSCGLSPDGFGMTLTTMMLEDDRTVESYGGLTPGAAVHASVDSAPASEHQPVTIAAAATATAAASGAAYGSAAQSPSGAVLLPCALVLQPSGKIAATQRLMLASEPAVAGADAYAAASVAPNTSGCWEYRYTDEGTAASAQSLFEADVFSTHCQVSTDPRAVAQDL
ncbi:hypothetical protein HYH02_015193 [Chlamydomonas schloesseri]|uniref:Ubiquitin-like domain-containing protein n=1 Tax=Chlamydomonas schloesseri TaxID=2026947 RepID=A0A835VSL2_9CHLO|nr:hypothetical protein HYH02_015193 [Chlamydomonas schloesseri]|eukprot:KAG2424303.1 hypothetical protein HYH02_015193 [Chlamydomonas schloesseri]